MKRFEEYLRAVRPRINARIQDIAQRKLKDDQLVEMLLGGKRLRAGLLSLVHECSCGKRLNGVLDLACAIELAHSASLIIDDMLDDDVLRRGMPAVHLAKGHKRAMLDTVGILSLPYDLAVPFGEDYVQSLAETQRGMVTGVLMELLNDPALPASKLYDTIIRQKTGRGFGLAASWGYMASRNGARRNELAKTSLWREYGIHVGKVMQIADDIADLRLMIDEKKTSGYGSELLLLRCVTVERLAQEFFSDIRRLDLHMEKARELLGGEGVQKSLEQRLRREIELAEKCLRRLGLAPSDAQRLLLSAPADIADIMLSSTKESSGLNEGGRFSAGRVPSPS